MTILPELFSMGRGRATWEFVAGAKIGVVLTCATATPWPAGRMTCTGRGERSRGDRTRVRVGEIGRGERRCHDETRPALCGMTVAMAVAVVAFTGIKGVKDRRCPVLKHEVLRLRICKDLVGCPPPGSVLLIRAGATCIAGP